MFPLNQDRVQVQTLVELINTNNTESDYNKLITLEGKTADAACQVYIWDENESYPHDNTFVCNRYIYQLSSSSDAEIQTDICGPNKVIIHSEKSNVKKVNKKCGTKSKVSVDVSMNTDDTNTGDCFFQGFSSIKSDDQLIDLAGTTFENFNIFLKRLPKVKCRKVSLENRLLIFLMKMKCGLTYSALGVLFCVHRTTISDIFISTLEQLCDATRNFVFWPDKLSVLGTMPECFKANFANTRVIIDCTEFRIEIPSKVDHRVWCYSQYKKGFTLKVLIGITPSGFICFKSKLYGGRKSDSQITIDSGILDLLEENDEILADKGFPEIKTVVDNQGKNVLLVMPPFLEKKSEFTKEECEETYKIASVRIHVERIMQRLRIYNILDKIPEHLFDHVDDILHMCCVLVNLQAPIIAES